MPQLPLSGLRPAPGAAMSLILLADRQPLAQSRQQLVAWSMRCAGRQRYHGRGTAVGGFVTGPCPRTVAALSRGLKETIYNAGTRQAVPLSELLGWLPWRRLVVIEQGCCWELPLRMGRRVLLPVRPTTVPLMAREAALYAGLGRGYAD